TQPGSRASLSRIQEDKMTIKVLIAAGMVAAFVTPSLAAEFYVQDTATKRCTIVEQKPTTRTTVVVGGDRVYTTHEQAEGAVQTAEVCERGGTVGGPAMPERR